MRFFIVIFLFLVIAKMSECDTLVFRLQQAINREKERRFQRFMEDVLSNQLPTRDLLKREIANKADTYKETKWDGE